MRTRPTRWPPRWWQLKQVRYRALSLLARARGSGLRDRLRAIGVAILCLVLVWSAAQEWSARRQIKYYPLVRKYKETLPCRGGGDTSPVPGRTPRPLGNTPDRDHGGRLRAAAVTLLRTPENACEASKAASWLREFRDAWPWLRSYDHVILHERDYVGGCESDLERAFNEGKEGSGSGSGEGRLRCVCVDDIPGAFTFPEGTEENGFGASFDFPTETRNVGYMHMCRLFTSQAFPYLQHELGYDYVLRMDDDNVPRTDVGDLFEVLHSKGAVYGYPAELPEWHRETAMTLGMWLQDKVFSGRGGAYLEQVNPVYFRNQTALQELAQNIFFTNFFVTKLGFWSEPHVLEFLGEVDGSGMAYKHRWGDAPLHHAVLGLFADSCSVLDLCHVDYKHGSTGHVIEGCALKRVERRRWDDEINPECRHGGRQAGAAGAAQGRKGGEWFSRADVPRCAGPTSEGSFTGPPRSSADPSGASSAAATFVPAGGLCYHAHYGEQSAKSCAGGSWHFFAGGQNAFGSFASLLSVLAPGLMGQLEYSVQFGRALDLVVDLSSAQVVRLAQFELGFEEGRVGRVPTSGERMGNPQHTTPLTEGQRRRLRDFLAGAPAPLQNQARITVLVCHYWQNAKDALWLASRQREWSPRLAFVAQVPSFETDSLCYEDLDYCWERKDPTRAALAAKEAVYEEELEAFLRVAGVACPAGGGGGCFVHGAMPAEPAHARAISRAWSRVGRPGKGVHLVEPAKIFASLPKETPRGLQLSSFASQWLLQMRLGAMCPAAEGEEADLSGRPDVFAFDPTCRGVPTLADDEAACPAHSVKHFRMPPLPARYTTSSNKEGRCKRMQERCVLTLRSP